MSVPARKLKIDVERTVSTSTILDFAKYKSSTVSVDSPTSLAEVLSNPSLEERLMEIVEGSVFSAITKMLSNRQIAEDPYDAVYLLDLEPDDVDKRAIGNLLKLKGKIKDISGELIFNDELGE